MDKDSVASVSILTIVSCRVFTKVLGIEDAGVDGCILLANRISSLYILPMPATIDWFRRNGLIGMSWLPSNFSKWVTVNDVFSGSLPIFFNISIGCSVKEIVANFLISRNLISNPLSTPNVCRVYL